MPNFFQILGSGQSKYQRASDPMMPSVSVTKPKQNHDSLPEGWRLETGDRQGLQDYTRPPAGAL